MRLIYRPIEAWPGKHTDPRQPSPFDAGWTETQELLERELRLLGVDEAVLQVDSPSERDFRLDGQLRADARLRSPAVILSFDSRRHGRLSYPCDTFERRYYRSKLDGWQSNVRAIALGLEALRKVERYGIANTGQQYTGWRAIGSGIPMPSATMSVEEASEFLRSAAEWVGDWDPSRDRRQIEVAYRMAAKRMAALHPDQGGDGEAWTRLNVARDVLRRRPWDTVPHHP